LGELRGQRGRNRNGFFSVNFPAAGAAALLRRGAGILFGPFLAAAAVVIVVIATVGEIKGRTAEETKKSRRRQCE
jgi:hypothetical protein